MTTTSGPWSRSWLWDSDPGPVRPRVDIGAGHVLPTYVVGPAAHSWWAMTVLIAVAATLFAAAIFSHIYLWTAAPQTWPASTHLPGWEYPLASAVLLIGSSGSLAWTSKRLERSPSALGTCGGLAVATLMLAGAFWMELAGQQHAGLAPTQSGYAAMVFTLIALQGCHVAVLLSMGLYTGARSIAGKLDAQRRVTFDNTMLLWHYAVVQGLIAVLLVHGFPRLLTY